MKRLSLLLILFTYAFYSFSQIELYKEIKHGTLFPPDEKQFHRDKMDPFYTVDYISAKLLLNIYDENYELVTIVDIPYKKITESEKYKKYNLYPEAILFVSSNVFSNTGDYEFIINFDNLFYVLFNERGDILMDFERFRPMYILNNKLVTYSKEEIPLPGNNIYRIYTIGGEPTKRTVVSNTVSDFYPNPAFGAININYSVDSEEFMTISDLNGKMVKEVKLLPENSTLSFNLDDFSAGIYIYSYGDISGKFIVK